MTTPHPGERTRPGEQPPPGARPGYEEAVRRLDRLADRLRVIGPRLAAREGPAARELLTEIRAGLQRLADLAADTDAEPRRAVPELAGYALADQVLVLGHDLLGLPGERSGDVLADAVRTFEEVKGLI